MITSLYRDDHLTRWILKTQILEGVNAKRWFDQHFIQEYQDRARQTSGYTETVNNLHGLGYRRFTRMTF